MNITYLTIILLTIFLFIIHNRNTNKEFFKTDHSKTFKKIQNSINLLNSKYVDINSQVMANYKFSCPKKKVKQSEKKIVKVTEDEELENITNDLYNLQEDIKKQKKIKQKTIQPIIRKPKRLDYSALKQEIINKDDLADIDEIEYIPKQISEQEKLNNYLKCYNKKIY